MSDKVYISGLSASAIAGLDHWNKPVPHPVLVDATFATDFKRASDSDNLQYLLNYAVISEKIATYLRESGQRNFLSLGGVAEGVFDVLESERAVSSAVTLLVTAPKLDIRAPVSYTYSGPGTGSYRVLGLRALTLIGVFTFERLNRQYVELDIDLAVPATHLDVPAVSESVHTYLEQANFKTVEALVKRTSQWILQNFPAVTTVAVHVTKPNAIVYTQGVGVSCESCRGDFSGENAIVLSEHGNPAVSPAFDLPVDSKQHYSGAYTVYIAFGSNLGNQVANIGEALALLAQHDQITVEATSALYVSKPMYHTDQADFYNGVVRVSVRDLSPHALLAHLKHIEYSQLHRTKHFANGPRTIDLDIVLYGEETVTTLDLVIPHKAMLERTFVLQPLCELIPPDFVHPVTAEPVHNHLAKLLTTPTDPAVQESAELLLVVPGSGGRTLTFSTSGTTPTCVMAIFNATPDLFSDGGDRFGLDPAAIIAAARSMKENGAQIIDIGGVSTRPGSLEPSADEELRRVLPVVQAVRSAPDLDALFVSVDTYRSEVAQAVLDAGADIINDISMGMFDKRMFGVISRAGCGYVMNHTRGTPATMSSLTEYGPGPECLVEYSIDSQNGILPPIAGADVVNGVCRELATQVQAAMAQNVRKWQIVLDPGIGFAKTANQNIQIIRHARRLKQYAQLNLDSNEYVSFHGLPVLLGPSRKKFLGTLTGQPADKRVIPTVAAVVAGIEQGADVVRVHDVEEVVEAVKTADAIYRS